MSSIQLRSVNEFDLSERDLTDLADSLRAVVGEGGVSLDVSIEVQPALGSGNAFFDTLIVWLPTAELIREHVYGPVLEHLIDYMKTRFRRHNEQQRPREIILLYGPDNKVMKTIEIDAPGSKFDGKGELL